MKSWNEIRKAAAAFSKRWMCYDALVLPFKLCASTMNRVVS